MIDDELVPGKLRIVRRIAAGGMGVVYEAHHLALDRRVAVKVLHPDYTESTAARTRFVREGRALAQLRSEYIVQVLDVDTLPSGEPYMVMEYLEGRDLRRELKKRGALPIAEAVGYIIHACNGIAVAHNVGIVHRDIKPANLFITNLDGERGVKVLDFGVARFTTSSDQDLTAPTDLLGTMSYMAPEQFMGSRADTRSDVWALGVVLFELITARSPFRGQSNQHTVAAVLTAPPLSLDEARPDAPLALAQVVMRCLSKNPEDRFADAQKLAALAPFGLRETVVHPSHRAARGSSIPPPPERVAEASERSLPPERASLSPATEIVTLTAIPVDKMPLDSMPRVALAAGLSSAAETMASLVRGNAVEQPREPSALAIARELPATESDSSANSRWSRRARAIGGLALLGGVLAICLAFGLPRAEAPDVPRPRVSSSAGGPPVLLPSPQQVTEKPTPPAPAESVSEPPPRPAPPARPPRALPAKPAQVSSTRRIAAPPSASPHAPRVPLAGHDAVPLHL